MSQSSRIHPCTPRLSRGVRILLCSVFVTAGCVHAAPSTAPEAPHGIGKHGAFSRAGGRNVGTQVVRARPEPARSPASGEPIEVTGSWGNGGGDDDDGPGFESGGDDGTGEVEVPALPPATDSDSDASGDDGE